MSDKMKKKCKSRYDENVERYVYTYDRQYKGYPGNQKRLAIMQSLVKKHNPARILYVGCGACIPMVSLIRDFGCYIAGIDFSEKMIQRGRQILEDNDLDPESIQLGDIEDYDSLPEGFFDIIIAPGVFTHLGNEDNAFRNINRKLKIGGALAIEFRNDLFSLFSFNRFSYDFYLHTLLHVSDLPKKLKKKANFFFKDKFGVSRDETILPKSTHMKNGYINKFHNPLIIKETFDKFGCRWIGNYFYHFHALPPEFEKYNTELYNNLSIALEDPLDWKGNFMASAFVSEAIKHQNI